MKGDPLDTLKNVRKKVSQSRKRGTSLGAEKIERDSPALEWICIS